MLNFIRLLAVILFFASCGGESKTPDNPATDIEVAQAFIRAVLDNRIDKAEPYLLKNETNLQHLDAFKRSYKALSPSELESYRKSDIIINEITPVIDDSVIIVNYSNTFKKDAKNKIKLVRIDGRWLVDLQYTFSGNM